MMSVRPNAPRKNHSPVLPGRLDSTSASTQNVSVVALYPWLLLPAVPVILVVLAFNFLGDGLRDAADPYK